MCIVACVDGAEYGDDILVLGGYLVFRYRLLDVESEPTVDGAGDDEEHVAVGVVQSGEDELLVPHGRENAEDLVFLI